MGWWDAIDGMRGDIVADALYEITRDLKKRHEGLTLPTLLAALTRTLNANPQHVSDPDRLPVAEVFAKLSDDARTLVQPAADAPADVVEAMNRAFATTCYLFEETLERKPTIAEQFGNLSSVLPNGNSYFDFQPDIGILYFNTR